MHHCWLYSAAISEGYSLPSYMLKKSKQGKAVSDDIGDDDGVGETMITTMKNAVAQYCVKAHPPVFHNEESDAQLM